MSATPTVEPTAAPAASGSTLSSAELARMRSQLDAMQHEIDGLQMPSDNDFDSAAGSLY